MATSVPQVEAFNSAKNKVLVLLRSARFDLSRGKYAKANLALTQAKVFLNEKVKPLSNSRLLNAEYAKKCCIAVEGLEKALEELSAKASR